MAAVGRDKAREKDKEREKDGRALTSKDGGAPVSKDNRSPAPVGDESLVEITLLE